MKRISFFTLLWWLSAVFVSGREAKLVRYPHYSQGRVAFTYLADIWTADENGQNLHRITVHKARDVYPRFSPDGRWIAFSSDRNGNLDVFVVPSAGGLPKQLTFHSSDDTVLAWSPDSKRVLFSANRGEDFMSRLYEVSIDDAHEKNVGADMGVWASYSPDGRKLAINRKAQQYWRKYYRGAYQTDITVMDIANRKFSDLTDFEGIDSWPMWSSDGHIYFISDREGSGLTNIWRVPESGGKAERVTGFTSGDTRWPAISPDGRVIVFEHDFGVWKLDIASRKVTPLKFDITAETQENLSEVRDFNSELDDYDLSPSGRRIALSVHGEIFTAPIEEGDMRQITEGPARDKEPQYSPDGKWIAYVSDRSGREEIYVAASDGSGEPQRITDLDALKFSFAWSPQSKEIAYTSSDYKLRKYGLGDKQTLELSSSRYGNIGAPAWSADGKWIAFSKADSTRNTDIYLIPSTGGEERKATFDSYSDFSPRFSPDGRKLFFIRSEGGFSNPASAQIYAVTLEREERDPAEQEERLEGTDSSDSSGDSAVREGDFRRQGARSQTARETKIDWPGLKRRTRQVTRMPFGVAGYAVAPDSRTIVFLTSEPSGTRTTPVIYSIKDDGKGLVRVSAGAPAASEENADTPRFGLGERISGFRFSRDGRSLFFKDGSSVYSVSMPPSSGSTPSAAGFTRGADNSRAGDSSRTSDSGRGSEGVRRRVNFLARVRVERPAEWAEMFDDAWRTMKYRFYDPKMHGHDWDAMKLKYQPLVEHVGDRQELLNIINEMIGELNASHTGAAPPPASREANAGSGNLGLELSSDESAGRYRVTHIYENGPADKDWVRVSPGNYLIAINSKEVRAGDNYWQFLNYRLNRKVEVTFSDKPSAEGAWKTRIEPVSTQNYSQLRYERWVKSRREMVDSLSGGRVGYLHIQAMNAASLRKFEKELRENRNKEALVIDERWNGGGNIDQELLGILVQRQYQVWQPRATEPTSRPFSGFFGPKAVLQNWRSASNAEMFPAGFRALGLGKVIGTPTMGAVIGTGSYSLIDGSTVRTPGVGVFLADAKKTNMENFGVRPDILVENTPEDNLADHDRQLETAVQELLKELSQRNGKP